jgi:hypothetical protein
MYYCTYQQATLIHLHNKTRSALLEIGMWWLGIRTWRQSQPEINYQEAQGQLYFRPCNLPLGKVGRKLQTTNCKLQIANCNLQTVACLPPLPISAPTKKSIYSRPSGSDFSFPSQVLLCFYVSNQMNTVANQHVMIIHQHMEAISTPK